MSDPANPLDWAAKAEEDYTIVLLCLRRKIPLAFSACFHAQQCAEKYMKGLLVQQGIVLPKIHDLVELSNMLQATGIMLPVVDDDLSLLTRYAAMTRYPGEDPTVEDARMAKETAKAVRRFSQTLLPPAQ